MCFSYAKASVEVGEVSADCRTTYRAIPNGFLKKLLVGMVE